MIEENDHLHLDLTLVYTDLGRINHDLRTDQERELWCYEMATEAKAPPGCIFPATREQKARAHCFAQYLARLLSNFHTEDRHWEIAESHMKMTRELVPELNRDDLAQVTKFMRAE